MEKLYDVRIIFPKQRGEFNVLDVRARSASHAKRIIRSSARVFGKARLEARRPRFTPVVSNGR